MPITPNGGFMSITEAESDIWATRMVFEPELARANAERSKVAHLPITSALYDEQIAHCKAQLDRVQGLEEWLETKSEVA